MTIQEIFDYVDEVKRNSFSNLAKTIWLNELEGKIQNEIMLLAQPECIRYVYESTGPASGISFPDKRSLQLRSPIKCHVGGLLTLSGLETYVGNNLSGLEILNISKDKLTLTFAENTFPEVGDEPDSGSFSFEGKDTEVLVKNPFDRIYAPWLFAKISEHLEESNQAANYIAKFKDEWEIFAAWYAMTYRPADGKPMFKGYYLRGNDGDRGRQGEQGEDGTGIVRLFIESGRLKYELTDGTISDAGPVSGIEIDPTLTIAGAAADAKATGDVLENEFGQIRDAFSDVFEVLGGKLSDAPSDGKQYARKDGAWSVVESGGVYIVHIHLFNGEYHFEQGGSWSTIIDALYISDKVVVAEVWNGDGDEEQYVYSFGGYGIAPEHGQDLVFYRAEGNKTHYLYVHRDNSISAETVDLDGGSGGVYIAHLNLLNGEYQFSQGGSWSAIYSALYNSDKVVVAEIWDLDGNDEQYVYSFGGYGDTPAHNNDFVFSRIEGEKTRYLYIHSDNTITAETVDFNGGESNNCEVKISYANGRYSADKTLDAIAEAIADGKFVYAVCDNVYYYYDNINDYFATFKRTFVDVDEVQDITFDIYNDRVLREYITYANVMNVEVIENDGEYTAYVGSETVSFADIEVAINNNRTVVVSFDNTKYPLSAFGNDVAQFCNTTINTSLAQVEEDIFVITPDGVSRRVSELRSGEPFLVTLTANITLGGEITILSASHTHAEILVAIEAGKTVELIVSDGFYEFKLPMVERIKDSAFFNGEIAFSTDPIEAIVDNSNRWTAKLHVYVEKSDLDDIYTKTETDNAIAAAIGDAIGGSY